MNAQEAYRIGLDMAEEIAANGDFSPEELASEDAFTQALYEISENRKQYAGEPTEDLRTDAQWDAYEEGLGVGFAKAVKARKFTLNPAMSRGHFELIARVLRMNRPGDSAADEDSIALWQQIVSDFVRELFRTNPNFDGQKFIEAVSR